MRGNETAPAGGIGPLSDGRSGRRWRDGAREDSI